MAKDVRNNKGGSLPLAPASSVATLPAVSSATLSPGLRPGPRMLSLDDTISYEDLLRSQSVTLKTGRGQHRKYSPYVLTEHDFKAIEIDGFKSEQGLLINWSQIVTA